MSNINITKVYKEINLVKRYQKICKEHNNFDNAAKGNPYKKHNEIIERLGYKPTYFKGEKFFRIEESDFNIIFGIQLTLKNGMVEIMLDHKLNDQ